MDVQLFHSFMAAWAKFYAKDEVCVCDVSLTSGPYQIACAIAKAYVASVAKEAQS